MGDLAGTRLCLVERVYEAAADPEAWESFLQVLADALHGVVPGLYLTDRATDTNVFGAVVGLDPRWDRAYDTYYHRCDLRRRRIRALPVGEVFVGSAILPDPELLRSEFYQDFLRPQGYFQVIGGVPLRDEDTLGVLRVVRRRVDPPFAQGDVAFLRRLMPHVSRALRLHRQLAAAEVRRDEAAQVLDWFHAGVLLLDGRGRVVVANRTAEELLARADGLHTGREGLRAAVPAETAALQQLVGRAAAAPAVLAEDMSDGALRLTRPSGRRPLDVLVAPLRVPLLRAAAATATVVVFVTDPEQQPRAHLERLQRYLGLTRAETALVLELARGRRLEDAATALGISVNTARTQLKRALAKTGTGRQAELVRLALGTPAMLGR